MKRCFKCQETKTLDAFYKHSKMSYGRLNKCIECTKKDARKHRQVNLEKIRAYDRIRGSIPHRVAARKEYSKTDGYKESHAKSSRKYFANNPKKYTARNVLNAAVRDKKIAQWPCMVCGAQKVEAHHPDYDRPLDVVWLCNKHHREAHALVANGGDKRPD